MIETQSFDVTGGAAGTLRRWVGTITWERDLTTQVVTFHIVADKTGPGTGGLYFYWAAVPVELRTDSEFFTSLPQADTGFYLDGTGYTYMWGAGTHIDATYRYFTGDPVQELPSSGDLLGDLNAVIEQVGVPVYPGYAPSGVALPYIVTRPIDIGIDDDPAVAGNITDWNLQLGVYCVAAGVQASFNLALAVMGLAQGARMRGTTLAASMGYNGAEIEGNYESQVTVQLNQGALT